MSDKQRPIDWSMTTFDGSRREQLRQAQRMTVRERLEALDQLTELSERLQAMPRQVAEPRAAASVHESPAAYRTATSHNDIVLDGCTPTPLANYLKALGVLRLLSEQRAELSYRAYWRNGTFVLRSPSFTGQIEHDRETISEFFLEEYRPSALVTPWNGRGGFLEGDEEEGMESSRAGAQMVRMFSSEVVANRFHPLATTLNSIAKINVVAHLNTARAELKRLKANEKAKGKNNLSDEEKETISRQEARVKNLKGELLKELRSSLPDDVLSWFDACLALVTDQTSGDKKSAPSPLLGAGGLDGSMDFGVNYLKRLNDVFEPDTGLPRERAAEWLSNALFGKPTSSLYSTSAQDKRKVSVGQFSPSDAGGYNADNGFTGEALLNPWNTILQVEGAVLFAASAVRRLEGSGNIYSSLPFTVAPTAIGEAVALTDEAPKGAKRKAAEMWLPLWSQPTTGRELEAVLREGRITLHGHSVTNGFDCVRALTSLGSSRGIEQFQRFAFLKRSGDAFFALDQGQFKVRGSVYSSLVEELDGHTRFLFRLHSFVRSKTPSGEWRASVKLRSLANQLDNHLVQILRTDDREGLLKILELLGEIQSVLAIKVLTSNKNDEKEKKVPPVPVLSEKWVQAADDGTPAFRIAKALAGLRGVREKPLPLRTQLFPVQRRSNKWMTPDADEKVRIYTRQRGRLIDSLRTLLERRLWLSKKLDMQDKPLDSAAGVTLDDINAFLSDDAMDQRIAALLPGLSLCQIPRDIEHGAGVGAVPAAFALLRLALTPDHTLWSLGLLPENTRLPVPAGMLAQLAAGNHGNRAVQTAWRRLRASRLAPIVGLDTLPGDDGFSPLRASAALLIPLRCSATAALARSVLEPAQSETEAV
jgi:CRISPR-associated protein Csx17